MKSSFTVDLEGHVIPLLQLTRMAVSFEHKLREIDENRRLYPNLDATLHSLSCATFMGESATEDAGMVLLLAIELVTLKDQQDRIERQKEAA